MPNTLALRNLLPCLAALGILANGCGASSDTAEPEASATTSALTNPYSSPYFEVLNRYADGASAEYLFAGQNLHSQGAGGSNSGCGYNLIMQSDGNLVLYGSQAWWASNTVNTGSYAVLQSDGNFVVYNWSGAAKWSSGTYDNQNERVDMQGDGNLVVYRQSGSAAWASGTNGKAGIPNGGFCVRYSEATVMEANADRPGGDYRSIWGGTNNDAVHCANSCAQDGASSCVAYSWVPASVYGSPVCVLKNTVNNKVADSRGVVTGYIKGRAVPVPVIIN